jgi:hypothetical protein
MAAGGQRNNLVNAHDKMHDPLAASGGCAKHEKPQDLTADNADLHGSKKLKICFLCKKPSVVYL